MKKIVIDPRVVKHLGRDLITSSEVAVVELIKNSIDAKARNIKLRLYTNGFPENIVDMTTICSLVPPKYLKLPVLLVEDDGCGMTDRVLEEGFLKIGTSIKVGDDSSLGEKGIGRLAAQRLGSALLLETASEEDDHTSLVFISWDSVIAGCADVPSLDIAPTEPHTRLWIFGITLEDYIDNAVQYARPLFSEMSNDIQINRNLQSALNFLIAPFDNNDNLNQKFEVKPKIEFLLDDTAINIDFPEEKLKLAESIHSFNFSSEKKELECTLSLKPWFIERVHRALVKATAFNRLKKTHEYYECLLKKNIARITNALNITLNEDQLLEQFYAALCDVYAVTGNTKKKELYENSLKNEAQLSINELLEITPIHGEIYSFKQGAAIGDKIIIDSAYALGYIKQRYQLNELKYFLDDYNGIKLYRGPYRIGFLGNKENDWVKLQQFRTKGQQWYRFDLGNTIGYVSLMDAGQNYIQEISSRLDISKNKTSDAFKLLINIVFNNLFYELNRKANDLMRIFLAEEGLLDESISKRVKKNSDSVKEMMRRNKQMQETLQNVSQHLAENVEVGENQVSLSTNSYTYLRKTLDSISNDIKEDFTAQETAAVLLSEADAQLKAIEVESYNNYKLMANGLITETITHELHSLSKTGVMPNASIHFDFLKEYFVQESTPIIYNQHVYPIRNSYSSISKKLEQVGDLYSFLETTFIKKGTYEEFFRENIELVIANIKENLLSTINKEKIQILCETKKLAWYVPRGVLLHVFYNLINNSLYWIDMRRKWAQSDNLYKIQNEDRIVVEAYGEDGLIIYDSGTGVQINMEDLLFEPLQSGKPLSEGRGMGLYIVKKLLNSFGGDIELLEERNEFGNRYKFLIVSNTSEDA